jgi:IclR family transcriptional regulator, pca regulon regulatory protein
VLAEADLRRQTSRTIRSPQPLREEIDRGRRQEYAIVDQELEVGLRSITAPIRDQAGAAVAAISVSTQASRTTVVDVRRRLLPPLRETAEAVASDLAAPG